MLYAEQEDRRIFYTTTMFALLIRCPAGNAAGDAVCPFAEFWNDYELEEKFMIAETLPDEKRRDMLCFHESCMAEICRKHRKNTAEHVVA